MSQTINVFKRLRNVRWPAADLYIGISKMFFCLVLTPWTSDLTWNFSHKYDGANPFKHLKAKMASLNFNMYLIVFDWKPAQLLQSRSHMIVFSCSGINNTCSKVLDLVVLSSKKFKENYECFTQYNFVLTQGKSGEIPYLITSAAFPPAISVYSRMRFTFDGGVHLTWSPVALPASHHCTTLFFGTIWKESNYMHVILITFCEITYKRV
jgi:hypothetical protein